MKNFQILLCNNENYISNYRTLASSGKELKDPFLRALAQREEANRSGKMTVRIVCMYVCITMMYVCMMYVCVYDVCVYVCIMYVCTYSMYV